MPQPTDEQILINAILSNKSCLFLGSGAVASSVLNNGNTSPVGSGLAEIIYNHFYPKEKFDYEALSLVSSMVQKQFGKESLFEFLQDFFKEIKPSSGITKLSKFKWSNIYTTNLDRAIEIAYKKNTDKAQKIKTIVGPKDLQTENKNIEVNLFKLHGCIGRPDIDLVFSLNEYAEFKNPHLKLFTQLSTDLMERPMIFIGYSLIDSNFQQVWAEIKKYCGTTTQPNRYFFIAPNIKSSLRHFLESEGFICFDYKIDEFADHISNLSSGKRTTLRDYLIEHLPDSDLFDKAKINEEVAYSLSQNYQFPKAEIGKHSQLNKNFYKGAQPNWSDIKHDLDAPRDLLEDVLVNFESWYKNPKFNLWLITGRAGDGKSTFIRRLALEISERVGDSVLFAKSRSNLSSKEILSLYEKLNTPLILFIDNTTDRVTKINQLISDFRNAKAKILIIGASRNSDWHAHHNDFYAKPVEFSLGKLSDNEIGLILSKLEINDALFKLKRYNEERRFELFKEKANSELIVAMREATMALNFEEIIANEYTGIKDEVAKNVYRHICFIHQFRYKIPQSLLLRVLEVDLNSLSENVYKYTKDIIYYEDDESETDILLKSRHPVIAEIVSRIYFKDDVEKVDFLTKIFSEYIPSNPLEASLIKKLYHHNTIELIFDNVEIAKSCYDILIQEVPDDYYVLQQKALFLVNKTDDYDDAKEVIKDALRLNPASNVLHHTHGMILMKQSLNEKDLDKSKFYLEEGKRILIRGARKNYNNVYNYHTLISYLISWYKKDTNQDDELIVEIQNLIDEASLKNPNDTLILTEHGKVYQLLKDPEQSKSYFEKAVRINSRNMAARYLLARIFMKSGHFEEAFKVCDDGVKLKRDEISLNRLRFELMHKLDRFSFDELKNEYVTYLSNYPKDSFIKLCYSAFLYINKSKECDKLFGDLRYSDYMSFTDKLKVIYDVNRTINQEDFRETGMVASTTATGYYLKSTRFNSRTMVFMHKNIVGEVNVSDRVHYKLLFNYSGGFAVDGEIDY
ncbi:SIR2 family protein [Olleya sp. HaHaR_3_96]|uniref:P-loop NTPase n=1 Tax=Olleya sp. HaHaR_3_96 TaxID=2745560 RepID=UPI001C4FB6C8|nr:SIR2 family protein [Olleya sp. HaHaR_3_96]QXP58753.1 SIR2 family protein [Olleya sp. HaHaR_3_96]